MKVAIYARSTNDNLSEHIHALFQKLNEYKTEIFVFEPYYKFVKQKFELVGNIKTFNSHTDLKGNVDVVLSLGGDGTFLETLAYVRNSEIPVLGINTGRLGFLANVAKTEINAAIDALVANKYTIEKRALLSVTKPEKLFGEVNYGLNELTILKKDTSSMITIHAYINGDYLNSYFADGLIIATPTGSTAYSLSCGGPLVMPGSQNFVITPIAPHNLNVRPMVVPDHMPIRISVEGRERKYLISIDGKSMNIRNRTEVLIEKAEFMINVIKFEDNNFLDTIRNKMMWGIDKRN